MKAAQTCRSCTAPSGSSRASSPASTSSTRTSRSTPATDDLPDQYTERNGHGRRLSDNNVLGLFAEDSWKATLEPDPELRRALRPRSGDAMGRSRACPTTTTSRRVCPSRGTPAADRKTSVRGGLGRFFYRLNGNLGVNMIIQGAPPPGRHRHDGTTVITIPAIPNPSGANPRGGYVCRRRPQVRRLQRRQRADALRRPVQHRRGPRARRELAFSADYIHTRGQHYVRASTQLPGSRHRFEAQARLRTVLDLRHERAMWYDGLLVRFDKRMSHHYQFSLAYTLSKTMDDTWPEFITQGGGPQAWYNPGAEKALSASLGAKCRRRRAASRDAERPGAVAAGIRTERRVAGEQRAALQHHHRARQQRRWGSGRSAEPGERCVRGIRVSGPGVQGDLGKNAGLGTGYFAIDMRIAKVVTLGDTKFKLIGEAFNVTNAVNYSAFQGNIRSALFNQPISARRPRTFQLGAQFDF